MATCLMIGLYLHEETQVDRFHEHADRIVQVGFDMPWGRHLSAPYPLAALLQDRLPAVEVAVPTNWRPIEVAHDASGIEDQFQVLYTEPAVFDVFSFRVVSGDAPAALATPDGVVITERLARFFFGDAEPIGQTLRLGKTREIAPGWREEETHHVVGAVIRDLPRGSTLQFDALAPISALPANQRRADSWSASMFGTYALLAPGTSAEELGARLPALLEPHFPPERQPSAFVMPLTSVYLSDLHHADGFRGQRRYVYVFGFAALFILLIAGINYVNLAIAQGLRRAREVGVRMAIGASRAQVARQFLGQSGLLCLAALVLGLGATALMLPGFNALFGTEIALREHTGALTALALFVLAVGVAAAAYPAFALSRFEPVRVLRGHLPSGSGGAGWLRKSLVVVQFAASSVLLIGTAVVFAQLQYVQTKDLGFDGEQVVVFEIQGERAWETHETLRQRAQGHPGVVRASATSASPGRLWSMVGITKSEASPDATGDPDDHVSLRPIRVDPYFLETLGIPLVAGRGFDPDQSAGQALMINGAMARALGWTPEEAVGKQLHSPARGEVIGVVEDFHVGSLREPIPPVLLQPGQVRGMYGGMQLLARLSPEDIPGAMRYLEATLAPFTEGTLSYTFLDDRFHALYESERRLARVVGVFAALAVLIACLGLFGLTALAAQQRTREIGIRKVLGATVASVVALLSRDFLKLVVVAFLIAAPVGYWMMSRWLEDFAYRITLGPGIFLLAGGAALAIALLTVGYHAVRAATADPVRSLRSE